VNDKPSSREILEDAKHAEAEGGLTEAARLYEEAIKQAPLNDYSYSRLMIIYRKLHQYKDELRVIDAGIRSFENDYLSKRQTVAQSASKKITSLSRSIMQRLGLVTNLNKQVLQLEPIAKWRKRRNVVARHVKRGK
jgi:tetratricopeptide (TPR) repeat protein